MGKKKKEEEEEKEKKMEIGREKERRKGIRKERERKDKKGKKKFGLTTRKKAIFCTTNIRFNPCQTILPKDIYHIDVTLCFYT